MLDWNEFNRELQNRISDPGVRVMFGFVYERLMDTVKQQDQSSKLIIALAETLSNFVKLNEMQEGRLQDLTKHVLGNRKGVELDSVPLTNEDD